MHYFTIFLLHSFNQNVKFASSDKLSLYFQILIMEIDILSQLQPCRGNSDWGNRIIISDQNVRMSTLPLPWLKKEGIYDISAVVHARYRKDQEFAQNFFKIFHWFT